MYVVAQDRVLCESIEPSSPCFPPFHHIAESHHAFHHLNVFLVALNADIKFQHYFESNQHNPPMTLLPKSVVNVMNHTIKLIKLLYWRPVPTKGSPGEKIYAKSQAWAWQNLAQGMRPDHMKTIEGSSKEAEMDMGEDAWFLDSVKAIRCGRQAPPWPEDADLETRMAIGRALMSGHGLFLVLSLSLFTRCEFTKMNRMIQNYLKMPTHFMEHTVGPSCYFLSIN